MFDTGGHMDEEEYTPSEHAQMLLRNLALT